MFRKKKIRIYFDNNIYNYLVDGITIPPDDCDRITDSIRSDKLEVILSPINFEEIIACFENKPEKARKMMAISNDISNRIAPDISDILEGQLSKFNKGIPLLERLHLPNKHSRYDSIRYIINNNRHYKIPRKCYDIIESDGASFCSLANRGIRYFKQELMNVYSQMRQKDGDFNKDYFNNLAIGWDLYDNFNSNPQTRRMFLETASQRFFGCNNKFENLNSFGDLPSLHIWYKVLFEYYKELRIGNSNSRPGDKNDIDQSIYYHFVDFVVVADTGRHGAFPNYQKIINEVINPLGKSAVSFDELLRLL